MYFKTVVQKAKDGAERRYGQLVQSVRTERGPRQKILVNLGRIDTDDGRKILETLALALIELIERLHLLDLSKDISGECSKELGLPMVFKKLDEKIGLKKILDKALGHYKTDFDISDALMNMILNRLSEPVAKNSLPKWQETQSGIEQYDSHQYYRTMDYLHEHQDRIEEKVYHHVKNLSDNKSEDSSIVLFDTTSIMYFGESDEDEELLQHGFSKERRGDLKQIVTGIAMTEDGLPLCHEVFSGNTNDQLCFKGIIKKLSLRFGESKAIFVGDRGLISEKNIDALITSGYRYILGFKMRTIPKADRALLFKQSKMKRLAESMSYRNVTYGGKRLIIYLDSERAKLDREHREHIIERIREKIHDKSIKAAVTNSDYRKYLKINGDKPIIDEEKIAAEAIFDGVFVLTTNTDLHAGNILKRYRDLWQCEHGFRTMKSELEVQPLHHRKDRRIRVHVFLCFLALLCKAFFNKQLKRYDPESSYADTIFDLKQLSAMTIKVFKSEVIVRTAIGTAAKTAFKALGMAFPRRVLQQSHDPSQIVLKV